MGSNKNRLKKWVMALFIFLISAPGLPDAVYPDEPELLQGNNFLSWYRQFRAGQANRPMYYEPSFWSRSRGREDETEMYRLMTAMNRNISDADIRAMAASGINSVRFKLSYAQFTGGVERSGKFHAANDFDLKRMWWNEDGFERLRRLINRLGEHQISSVLCLTGAPGGIQQNEGLGCRLHKGKTHFWKGCNAIIQGKYIDSETWQKVTIELWKKIVLEFGDNEYVLGYELLDEPLKCNNYAFLDYVVTLVPEHPEWEDPAISQYEYLIFYIPEYLHPSARPYKGFAAIRLLLNSLTRAIRQAEAQNKMDHKWIFRPNPPGVAEEFYGLVLDMLDEGTGYRIRDMFYPDDDLGGDDYEGPAESGIIAKLHKYFPGGFIKIVDPLPVPKTAFSPHWYRPKWYAIHLPPGTGQTYPDPCENGSLPKCSSRNKKNLQKNEQDEDCGVDFENCSFRFRPKSGECWDRDFMSEYDLIQSLEGITATHHFPIWFSEFEARNKERFGGDQYLSDITGVMEDKFWGWSMYSLGSNMGPDTRKWALQDPWAERNLEYLCMPPFPAFSQTYDLGDLYAGMNDWDYWGITDSISPDGKCSFDVWPQYFGVNSRPAAALGFTEDTNYASDGSDASFGGSADNGGDWTMVSRQSSTDYAYECTNTSAKPDISRFGHNSWRDITFQGKMKFGDTGCGIVFRAPSSQTYYAVMLESNPDKFVLLEVIDGVVNPISETTASPSFQLDQWYKFKVVVGGTGMHGSIMFYFCDDASCSFSSMGSARISYTGGTLIQRGRVGFIVNPEVTATFDDVDVLPNTDNLLFKDDFQRTSINGTGAPVTWSGNGSANWSLATDPDDSQNFTSLTPEREDVVLEADESGEMSSDVEFGAGIIDVRVRTPQKGNPVICFLENVDSGEKLLGAKILMGRTDPDYSSDYQGQLQLQLYKDGAGPETLARMFYPFRAETWYHLRVSFHRVCFHGDTYPEGFYVRIYVDDMLHPLIDHVVTGDDISPDDYDAGPVVLKVSGLDTNDKAYFDNVMVWECDSDGSFGFTENFSSSGYADGNFDIISGAWAVADEDSNYFLRGAASYGTGSVSELGDTIVPHSVVAIKPDDPLINDYEFSGKIRIHSPNSSGGQEFYRKRGSEIPLRALIGFRRSSPAEQYACNFQFEGSTLLVQLLRRNLSSSPLTPLRCGSKVLAEKIIGDDLTDKWLEFSIEVTTRGPDGFPRIEITVTDDQSTEYTLTYEDKVDCLAPSKGKGNNPYGYWHHQAGYLSLEVMNMPYDLAWGDMTTVDWDNLSLVALDPCNEE